MPLGSSTSGKTPGLRPLRVKTPRSPMSPMPPSPLADGDLREALARHPLPDHLGVDKQARGTVLVIGGSARTPGAVVLAGRAALRIGAGRLQLATAAEVVS